MDLPAASDIRDQRIAIGLAILIFSAISLWAAIASEGFLEADGCTHYLYARFAFQHPHFFVNVWGRPICTAIYSIPAAIGGRLGVRVMSLMLALSCAGVTYAIAKRQGYRWPALALLFTLAQPLVFLHSFSELTELPFATLLACAFWAYQSRRWLVMAILVALGPLSRPEGFGFLVLAAIALVVHRRWWWLIVLPIPLMLWNYVGWAMYGHSPDYPWWMWLKHEWPYAATSVYDSGSIFHFVMLLPAVTSPLIFPAMVMGIWRSLNLQFAIPGPSKHGDCKLQIEDKDPSPNLSPVYRGEASDARHVRRCQLLIAVLPLLILIGHSVLYWRGKMASSGELRYMLVVAPFWALLSASGWEWIFARLNWKHILRWAGAAAIVPILINCKFSVDGWTIGYKVLPLTLTEDWERANRVAEWYRHTPLRRDYPYICAAHPGIFYFLDLSPSGVNTREWRSEIAWNPPSGTLLVWDPMYGRYNADSERSIYDPHELLENWILLDHIGEELDIVNHPGGFTFDWQIFLSPETIRDQPTPSLRADPESKQRTFKF